MCKVELGELAFRALGPTIPSHLLRGIDLYANEGGDLDFIVPPGLATKACMFIAQAALEDGWFLAGFRDIGYVCSVTLIRLSDGVKDAAVKLDFINGFAWYAIGNDESVANPFSDHWRSIHKDWSDPRIAGALTFFQKIMASGSISSQEWDRITATGADATYLAETAQRLQLPITRAQIEQRRVTGFDKWRLRASSGGVHGPVSAAVWFLRAGIAHLKFKLGIGTGMGLLIGVSGLDGSGKSTLVNRLIAAYIKAGGVKPQLVHLLPSWIPMPHQLFRRHKTKNNYTRPYSEPPVSSKLNGGLRLVFYLCAFTSARLSLWLAVKRGRLIILDRSLLDFASDLTRARIPARRLPGWLVCTLMPAGRLFYLNASPKVVVARKGELTLEKAQSLQVSYHDTCKTVGATMLNGDDTPDAIITELLGYLSQEYMQRIEAAAEGYK